MKRQRNTRQRSLVLKAVQAHREHPSADQIYLFVRAQDPRISRGTVYRNLHLLVENGEARHVKMPDTDRFDWRVEPHYHLRCLSCGKVSDVPIPYRAELDRELSEQSGYQISFHCTTFEGLCPDCAREKEPAGK